MTPTKSVGIVKHTACPATGSTPVKWESVPPVKADATKRQKTTSWRDKREEKKRVAKGTGSELRSQHRIERHSERRSPTQFRVWH